MKPEFKKILHDYRHFWILSYELLYLAWFTWLQYRTIRIPYYVLHDPLDDKIPFVLIGRRYHEDGEMDYVVCDDYQGGYLAGRHLVELGHRRVLIVVPNDDLSSARERLEGFSRAMEEAGQTLDAACILRSEATGQGIGQRVLKRLRAGGDFTAMFCFSDYITWEIIYALNEAGIRVPEDVSIVSFDNVQSRMCFPPPLTTVHYPKLEVAERSVELLLDRIAKPDTPWRHIVNESHIVVRSTTRRANNS